MFLPTNRGRAAGIAVGYLADLVFADPRRGHPVAGFGTLAAALERHTYRDSRAAGAVHTAILLSALAAIGIAADRAARGPLAQMMVTAAATYTVLGGTSLARTGSQMATRLDGGRIDAARELLPSLCGRDPSLLDADGLARATVESVAENTSDAQVAPILWGALAGAPGLLVYRGANTLDAMIGHRSPRYENFGWAAARFDDALNLPGARLAGLCVLAVSGRPGAAWRAWRADARKHPSPNAGVVEASFAGALGVQLGGVTQYPYGTQIRPTLGDGRPPAVRDVRRAVALSRRVQALAAVVAVGISAVGRTGRPACPR